MSKMIDVELISGSVEFRKETGQWHAHIHGKPTPDFPYPLSWWSQTGSPSRIQMLTEMHALIRQRNVRLPAPSYTFQRNKENAHAA